MIWHGTSGISNVYEAFLHLFLLWLRADLFGSLLIPWFHLRSREQRRGSIPTSWSCLLCECSRFIVVACLRCGTCAAAVALSGSCSMLLVMQSICSAWDTRSLIRLGTVDAHPRR